MSLKEFMTRTSFFISIPVIVTLIGCGGGGGGGGGGNDAIDLNAVVGQYGVKVHEIADSGNCAVTSFSVVESLNGITSLGQTSTGQVEIRLPPGMNTTLEGGVSGNTLQASGGIPLGGMGAGTFHTTWTYLGDDAFEVQYSYSEDFVGQTSACSKGFVGTARRTQ